MPKNLKLGDLAKNIKDNKDALAAAKTVETKDMQGNTVLVSKTKVNAAIKAMKGAEDKMARLCQQGVFGVKVSP
jgi:hypothetical protein